MKIYFIRHGETTSDVEGRYGGDYDDSLTEKGILQVKELAEELKNEGIEFIYHSPKKRAIETANILNETLNLETEEVNDIRERNNYGVITGMTREEAMEKHPKDVKEIETVFRVHKVTGSESFEDFSKRVLEAYKYIKENDKYKKIAVVCHGGPISYLSTEIFQLESLKKIEDCGYILVEDDKIIKHEGFVL